MKSASPGAFPSEAPSIVAVVPRLEAEHQQLPPCIAFSVQFATELTSFAAPWTVLHAAIASAAVTKAAVISFCIMEKSSWSDGATNALIPEALHSGAAIFAGFHGERQFPCDHLSLVADWCLIGGSKIGGRRSNELA
jgi:hypothetical protein